MNQSCSVSPGNKRDYIADLAKILLTDFGRKKYYSPEEVKKAHRKSGWNGGMDFSCWGMSVFSSHNDFNQYHQETGEACSYTDMKAEMLSGISDTDLDLLNIGDVNLDASWLDFGAVFEGIGDFFSSLDIGIDF